MDPFAITFISATPAFTTFNGNMQPATVKNKSNGIWSSTDPGQYAEGPTGSKLCASFRLSKQQAGVDWSPIQLQVQARSSAVPTWYQPPDKPPAKFKVMARLDASRDDILVSDEMVVSSTNPVITIDGMRVVAPVHELPFRNAGEWTWILQRTDVGGFPPIFATKETRLELSFFFAALAPTGPWDYDPSAMKETQPDFKDGHYIDLVRLFLPNQWEIVDAASKIKGSSSSGNNSPSSLLAWYVNRLMATVWAFGGPKTPPHQEYPNRPLTKLDVVAGASFYLSPRPGVPRQRFQPQYGGCFELRRWMLGLHAYCSIFDLAALVQLGCALVQDVDGKEVLQSKWVAATGNASLGQIDFGYINPGPLFGWPTYPACNSPVFASGGVSDSKDDNERFPLPWHAWIEIKLPDNNNSSNKPRPVVLDASQAFGSPAQPSSGTLTREGYLGLKLDTKWPKPSRLPTRIPEMANSDAIIYFSTPETHLNRIGVLGIGNSPL